MLSISFPTLFPKHQCLFLRDKKVFINVLVRGAVFCVTIRNALCSLVTADELFSELALSMLRKLKNSIFVTKDVIRVESQLN